MRALRSLGSPVEILYAGTSDREIEAVFAQISSQRPGRGIAGHCPDPFFCRPSRAARRAGGAPRRAANRRCIQCANMPTSAG